MGNKATRTPQQSVHHSHSVAKASNQIFVGVEAGENETNVLRYEHNLDCWEQPKSSYTHDPIERALLHNKSILLLTVTGKLYSIPQGHKRKTPSVECENVTQVFADDYVKEIEPVGMNSVLIVLRDKVCEYKYHNFKMLYDGPTLRVHGGGLCAFILTEEGYKVYGENSYGQLGTGTTLPAKIFVKNDILNKMDVDEIHLGGWHSYAKLTDGTFYGWGYNTDGRLGNGGNRHVHAPTLLQHHLLGIRTLVCGGWHTLGLTSAGDVYIWGQKVDHNMGSIGASSQPVLILSGMNITKMFSGTYSCTSVVQSTNSIYIWGRSNRASIPNATVPTVFDKVVDLAYVHAGYDDVVFTLAKTKTFAVKNIERFSDVTIVIYI